MSSVSTAVDVRRQTNREGDDRERWIGVSGCRKDRASGDEQVVETVHLAVLVDHSLPRIGAHARRANVM